MVGGILLLDRVHQKLLLASPGKIGLFGGAGVGKTAHALAFALNEDPV